MSTSVTSAGNLTGDRELHTGDAERCVVCPVAVTHRIQNEAGEWGDGDPTGRNVTIYGTAANHFYDSARRSDRVVVHVQLRSEAWREGETDEKCPKQVETFGNRFGEVGRSLKYDAARLERQTAPAATAKN